MDGCAPQPEGRPLGEHPKEGFVTLYSQPNSQKLSPSLNTSMPRCRLEQEPVDAPQMPIHVHAATTLILLPMQLNSCALAQHYQQDMMVEQNERIIDIMTEGKTYGHRERT